MLMTLEVSTRTKSEFQDITAQVQRSVAQSGVQEGVCHVFLPHTTASLTLNENWDPDVRSDLVRALAAMLPQVRYDHGEGNSPAHLMASLLGASETLLISEGRLLLGSWQGVYLAEFDGPRRRRVLVKVMADPS